MKALALLCLVAAAFAADVETYRLDVVTTLASHHWVDRSQQEINPGCGLSLGLSCDAWTPFVEAVCYDDSRGTVAAGGFIGARFDVATWWGVEGAAGYLNCATYRGVCAAPGIYAGTDRLKFTCTVLGTRSLGFSLRWRL